MDDTESDRVTALVSRLGSGDAAVAEELLPLVYDELRGVAGRLFAQQPEGHSLRPTDVVHEAWLKLGKDEQGWEGRSHFFSVAARAMRQVLTDYARARRTDRRGRGWRRVTFDDRLGNSSREYDLVAVDDALQSLAQANTRHARVVELRIFAGMSVDEVATVLGVTPRTIKLDWRSARAWLLHAMEGPQIA